MISYKELTKENKQLKEIINKQEKVLKDITKYNKGNNVLIAKGITSTNKNKNAIKYFYGVLNNQDLFNKEDLIRCIKKAIKELE